MIWHVEICLKLIFERGRDYPWERPGSCPRCQNYRVWGHGFVPRYFDGFSDCLLMRCYRCPACGCVITARPTSHFRYVRCRIETIRSHLKERLSTGRWPPGPLARSRLRHWLANLKRQVQACLTSTWAFGLLAGFDELRGYERIPVARVR